MGKKPSDTKALTSWRRNVHLRRHRPSMSLEILLFPVWRKTAPFRGATLKGKYGNSYSLEASSSVSFPHK